MNFRAIGAKFRAILCLVSTLGRTPFWCAALHGQCLNLEILHRNGANIEVQDHDGKTPLMMAVWMANDETVEMLLQMGASLDTRDRLGQTALHVVSFLVRWCMVTHRQS